MKRKLKISLYDLRERNDLLSIDVQLAREGRVVGALGKAPSFLIKLRWNPIHNLKFTQLRNQWTTGKDSRSRS